MTDTMQRKTLQAAGVVTRSPDGEDEEQEYIKVPISSTAVDRDGDEFSRDGLEDLRDQVKTKSRPVFENHGRKEGGGGMFGGLRYDWKDIIGSLDDAEIEEGSGDDPDVLNGYIRPNPENERGTQLTRYVKEDMPVGFSIGFGVGEKEEKDAGGLIFHSTDLMELSSVGIQSNRESTVTSAADTAVAMAKAAGELDADLDESTMAKAIVDEMLAARDGETDNDPADRVQRVHKQMSGTDSGATSDMADDKDNDTNDELFERLVSLQEDAVEERSEIKDRLAALEKEDGEDDEDEDEDDEEDDDGKSNDVDLEKLQGDIEELRSALDDVEAEDSETKSSPSDDEGETKDDTSDGDFEL